jgi:hypothetical protein
VDGNDLSKFKILGNLASLQFVKGKNAAAVLKKLKGSTQINLLAVRDDDLTDTDLKLIAYPHLSFLNIRGNPALTAAGLKSLLSKQKALTGLELDCDPSLLPVLGTMTDLKTLNVGGAIWTDEQKATLRQSLPKCKVNFEDGGPNRSPDLSKNY